MDGMDRTETDHGSREADLSAMVAVVGGLAILAGLGAIAKHLWGAKPYAIPEGDWHDVPYGTDQQYQTGRLWLPKRPDSDILAFVWHGGFWTKSDPVIYSVEQWFRSQGWAVCFPKYRLAKVGTTTGLVHRCIEDAAAVVHYVTSNKDWKLSKARLLYSGFSAGGHLAWMMAVAKTLVKPDGTPSSYTPPPRPMAVVSLAGAGLDVLDNDQALVSKSSPFKGSKTYFDQAWGHQSQWRRWSPGGHIGSGRPPCKGLIVQGTADEQLPKAWVDRFHTNLQNKGWKDVRLVMLPGLKHAQAGEPWRVRVEDWRHALC